MIYLIGGSPRSGKTMLAKMLAEKTGLQHISIDDLRPVVLEYISKEQLEKKMPCEFMYENDNDAFFEKYSAQEMIDADLVDAMTMWKGVKAFIAHRAIVDKNIVIEGVQLLPKFIDDLRNEPYFKDIKIVYLFKEDEEKILDGFTKNENGFDWLLQGNKNKETLPKAAKMIKLYGEYFKREAEKYGFAVFNAENDFDLALNNAVNYLEK